MRDYTPKKIAKRDRKNEIKQAKAEAKKNLKQNEKKRKKNLTKSEKKSSMPPYSDMFSLFSRIINLFFSKLFYHLHFHVARIRVSVGSTDAAKTAMIYCGICTALNPVLIFLDKHSNLHGMKKADIQISTNYLSEEIKFDIKLGFSISLGGLLSVLFKSVFSLLLGWIKIKPASQSNQSKASENKASSSDKTKVSNA